MQYNGMNPVESARAACGSVMASYTPAELPPAGIWHYHQGVFLSGVVRLWEVTGAEDLYSYVRGYVDNLVRPDGTFEYRKGELDAVQAGTLLFPLYERTGDERYRKAADFLAGLLENWKTTSDGGFWHKEIYPNQMWLDGLYMQGPFSVRYAAVFGKPSLYDMVVKQALLLVEHTRVASTGLLRHAWEETRLTSWADPETGRAPEYWGRALGWFPAALLDILDWLPETHPGRNKLIAVFRDLMAAVVTVQDRTTGLWYQVLDKGDRPGNWLETSCSSLFTYALAKGVTTGFLEPSYADAALAGFRGTLSRTSVNAGGRFEIRDICIGTGVGNYEHYIGRARSTNDLHGVGAFVMSAVELHRMLERTDFRKINEKGD